MADRRNIEAKHSRYRRRPSAALAVSIVALFAALAGTALALQANSVRSKHIVNSQVKARDLAVGAVGRRSLGRGAVKPAKLATGAVGSAQLANAAVNSAAVANGSLGGLDFAGLSLGNSDLATGAATAGKVAANSVDSAKVPTGGVAGIDFSIGSIAAGALQPDSVGSSEVLDNGLTGADFNEATLGSPIARTVTRVDSSTASDSTGFKQIEVSCPGGRFLLGGGAQVEIVSGGNATDVALVRNFPVSATTWLAAAVEPVADDVIWWVSAYGICAAI